MFYLVLFLWQARTTFVSELEKTEDWLYEEGDDQSKKVYQEKLDALKVGANEVTTFNHSTCSLAGGSLSSGCQKAGAKS